MEFSLCSSLKGCNMIFLSRSRPNKPRKQSIFIASSCRATKLSNENETTNFYKILSLSTSNVSVEEIKRAYRTMARRYHPDVCHPSMKEESTKMFLRLHAAYETLSDPILREAYDYSLGLTNFERKYRRSESDRAMMKSRWRGQIVELKRRSSFRGVNEKEGTWGSRMRARNINTNKTD